MKINALDEYGLRIMIRIAKADPDSGLSISQLSELEGLTPAYVAKITRALREAGLISSTRGHKGGYTLVRPAHQITINDILRGLGGELYDSSFCQGHSGEFRFCTNSMDCTVRSLWKVLQKMVDHVLLQVTLSDMIDSESTSMHKLQKIALKIIELESEPCSS